MIWTITRRTMQPQRTAPQAKQLAQVMLATLLVAGTPVAAVWWLRMSGTVESEAVTLLLGVAISLVTSWAGRVVWEKHQGSEDLLFSELMVWGYLHRRLAQRRLASTAQLAAPLQAKGRAGRDPRTVREQTRLLEGLVSGMETRDPYLHGHSRRVARHAWMIARHMKLDAEQVARIRTAAALHDVGKTKTPKTILHKAGPLTDEEYRIIKLHPGEGAEMATVLGDPELEAMIRHHHERLDGSGYPEGLRGGEIPLGARIIAVADTFDAITSARPYRGASPHRKAIDILHGEAAGKLDPDVVRAFCGHYAGRGPLALWSFVCSVPERMLSWLSASAGTVATAAKVAAVAALVGGAAATSATLGIANAARPDHEFGSGTAVTHVASAPAASPSQGASGAATNGDAKAEAGHARHPKARVPRAKSVSPASVSPGPASAAVPGVSAPAGSDSHPAQRGESSGGSGHQEAPRSEKAREPAAEAPKAKHEEAPVKSKEEAPAKAKGEEKASKGKSEEVPGQSKPEEAPATSKHEEASSTGNSGSGGSSGNSGKDSSGSSGGGNSGKGFAKNEAGGKGPSGESG